MNQRKFTLAALCGVALLLAADTASAAEKVKMGAMHMCCPTCEKVIYGTLKKVKGVTLAKVDRAGNNCSFTASSMAVAEEAIMALVKDGYWADIRINSEKYVPPVEKVAEGQKFDVIVFGEVHLCCNACGVSIGNTVEIGQPKGLEEGGQDYNRTAKTATFTGKNMDPLDLLQCMHNAGFHGKLDMEKSKKAE